MSNFKGRCVDRRKSFHGNRCGKRQIEYVFPGKILKTFAIFEPLVVSVRAERVACLSKGYKMTNFHLI